MDAHGYHVEPVESPPFAEVAYLVWLEGRTDALVVDPGFDPEALIDIAARRSLSVVAVLNTHGHVDHIAGNAALKRAFPAAPLLIGRRDAPMLTDSSENLSALFGAPLVSPPADRLLDDGERLELAGLVFEVRDIPGHSPGSVVFVSEGLSPPFVFGGDVIFAGSVGRTDLGGDAAQLLSGIKARLFDLPDDTVIFPGHGSRTTVGRERRSNPFVGERAGLYGIG